MCRNGEASVSVYLGWSLIVSAWFPLFIVLWVALIAPSLPARALITAPIPHSLWQITSSAIKTIILRRRALINIPIMLCNYISLICGCGWNLWKQSLFFLFSILKQYKCWDFFFFIKTAAQISKGKENERRGFLRDFFLFFLLQMSLLQWTTEALLLPYNSSVILSFFTALQYF